jgi:hypothetical protein
MSDLPGFWLIRATIWLAVAAWLVRVFLETAARPFAARNPIIRASWTIGALACLGHAVAALGIGHCWSLTNAMRHTAMVTRQVMGVELPWAVFVNFAFVAAWLADAARELPARELPSLGWVRHSVWLLMMLNGTVVFGPRYWTWIAAIVVAAFAIVRWRSRSRAGAGR